MQNWISGGSLTPERLNSAVLTHVLPSTYHNNKSIRFSGFTLVFQYKPLWSMKSMKQYSDIPSVVVLTSLEIKSSPSKNVADFKTRPMLSSLRHHQPQVENTAASYWSPCTELNRCGISRSTKKSGARMSAIVFIWISFSIFLVFFNWFYMSCHINSLERSEWTDFRFGQRNVTATFWTIRV